MTALNQLQQTAVTFTQNAFDNNFNTYRELCIYRGAVLTKAAEKFEMAPEADALNELTDQTFVEDATEEEMGVAYVFASGIDESIGNNYDTNTNVPAILWLLLILETNRAIVQVSNEDESETARLEASLVSSVVTKMVNSVIA